MDGCSGQFKSCVRDKTLQSEGGNRVTQLILRFRFPLFVAALVAAASCVVPASRLVLNRSIESLFAADNPHLVRFLRSKAWFGGDEFVIVAYEDDELFLPDEPQLSPQSEKRIRDLVEELNQIPGIDARGTNNLADSMKFKHRRLAAQRLLAGVLLSDDHRVTAIILRLEPSKGVSTSQADAIARVREVVASRPFDVFVVGEPVQVQDTFRYVEEDGTLLWRTSLLLLAAVILICLRSVRWMLLPLVAVVCAILWTNATLYLLDFRLSMVSSMLNSLVTIICVATTMHLALCYRDLRRDELPLAALKKTFRWLLPPVFWACITTAVGFGTLLISQVMPIFSFGFMMVVAICFLLLAFVCLFPMGMLWGDMPKKDSVVEQISGLLPKSFHKTLQNRRKLGWSMAAITVFAFLGMYRIEIETNFSRNFRRSSPIIHSLEFVESRLGGAGSWEINFSAPQEPNDVFYERVRGLAQRLRDLEIEGEKPLTKVIAVTDGLDLIPNIPLLRRTQEQKLLILNEFQPEFSDRLYNVNEGRMRIMLRSLEMKQSAKKVEAIDAVEQLAREEFPDAETTGLYLLLAYVTQSLLQDQLLSFSLALVGISGMLCFVFRSWRLGLVALVPNLFPIILVLGMMGWSGWKINIATAMMACISLGLTIDSSIHYLTRYQRLRKGGASVLDALEQSHCQTGRALVLATMALIAGFSTLSLSHFIPLVDFGILVSLAMLGGLVGNLMLLPLLVPWADRG